MGTRQVSTGKGNTTINTLNVWDRIIALEAGAVSLPTDHSTDYTYYPDGNVQTVTEKDGMGNPIKTTTYTYNASGDVSSSVTVAIGKTLATTYNYDQNGNITSTTNVFS